MGRTIKLLVVLFVGSALLFINACKDKEECANPGLERANISGLVKLYDEAKQSLDNDGMYVYIVGTVPEIGDTTDEGGLYTFNNVDFGSYTIAYEKEGYGDLNLLVNHTDQCELTNQVPDLPLGQKSSTNVTAFTSETIGLNTILDITVFPEPTDEQDRYIRIFYHNESNVSNYTYTRESGRITMTSASIQEIISINDFFNMGFTTGETVFVKVYGDSFYSNEYFDQLTSNFVFPNVNIVSQPHLEIEVP